MWCVRHVSECSIDGRIQLKSSHENRQAHKELGTPSFRNKSGDADARGSL